MEKPATAKLACGPMMLATPVARVAPMLSAEIGVCGVADSPDPGRSGTSSMKSAASASMLRTQCIQLPVPPWSRTSGAPVPHTRHTTSPAVVRCVLVRSSAAMNSAGVSCEIVMQWLTLRPRIPTQTGVGSRLQAPEGETIPARAIWISGCGRV